MTTIRPISPGILALIRAVAERVPGGEGPALLRQAEQAAVVDEVPGRMLDVSVPESVAPVRVPDGLVEPAPAVLDETGNVVGELLVWVTGGRLASVERPWFTDEPPEAWPEPSALGFD